MTDTGQVPGEGLPESAGMVEQPGAPAHGAYAYLSEDTVEDEDLLLPGSHGAWGNEVTPPAPEPVVEAVHQPGPHELSGRDSGSVDLGGVRLPDPPPIPPTTPRRPLHLGPPLPDSSASPVRSLADRGPADAPVRQPAPASAGPEYLDAPRAAEPLSPPAAPWGAQPTPQAQVSAGAAPAETVVPAPHPTGTAQAVATDTAEPAPAHPAETEQLPATAQGTEPTAAPGPDEAQAAAAEAESAVPVQGAGVVGEPGAAPDVAQAGAAQAQSPVPAQGAEVAGEPGAAEVRPEAGQVADAEGGQAAPTPGVTDAAGTGTGPEADPPVAAQAGQVASVQGAEVAADPTEAGIVPAQTDESAPVDSAGQDGEQGAAAAAPETPGAAVADDFADGAAQGPAAAAAEQGVAPAPVPEAVQAAEAVPSPEAPVMPEPAVTAPPAAGAGEAVAAPGAAEAPAPAQATGAGPEAAAPDVAAAAAPEPDAPGAEAAAPAQVTGVGPEAAAPGGAVGASGAAAQAPDAEDVEAAAPEPDATGVEPATHPAEQVAPQANSQASEATDVAAAAQEATPEQTTAPEAPADAPAAPAAETVAPAVPADAPTPEAPADAPAQPVESAPAQAADTAPAQPAETVTPDPSAEPPAPAQATESPVPDPAAETPVETERPAPEPTASTSAPAENVTPPAVGEQGAQPVLQGPQQSQPPAAQPARPEAEPVVIVPAPREGDAELAQNADDLDTRAAEQEDPADQERHGSESAAEVPEARQPTGPAAPGYDPAEREAVLKVMRERRDIRNGFRSDPIPHEVLLRVLEAAHHAPSVGHSQPWDFVVIRSADTRRAMHELAMRQRDAYAKSLPKGRAKQFKELKIEAILDTPVNIVVTADPTRGGRHTLGRHSQPQMAPYSAALAVENLWLAARAEGLGVGWVSFFDEREMVRSLGLPEHLEVIAYLCVGYVDEFPDEPELLQAGWSKRRPLSWVVHEETYGRRALPGEEPHDLLAETVAQIRPLDAKALGEAWERQKRMTKPAGALGMLEIISAQLSGLSRQCPPPIPEPAAVAIFAGDHGVHAQGVTPWPQEVTAQMVANFLGGGAVCNAFATQVGAEVCIVDVGVAADLPATPGLLPRKVRAGTSDMTTGPAMTRDEARQAIEVGIETARDLVAAGNKALLTGEMGIGNTTASAALISVFTGAEPAEVTGRGTGINDETLARKTEVVRRALELHQPDPADPIGVLAAIGGFEHAATVGLLLGGASLRTPVILDGVSAGAAALVARAIAPEVLAACIAGHRSAEPGHVAALNKLGLRPLVDLDLRLGEGTGALLALPLVQSTARAMHEVATFDSAGVTEK
ncbi:MULTISPECIES: nicotinate-nucleotide--dimethylbenzimidazole phosphoribosyltransferase [unclassified Streptomyces]|uniref:nicotinate-nucleotide--dimethylbenzimidazole phosphoribosyltransferase n=1 Tax=unclassified Streptomyces TaxID=2593676 RepID=UPI0004BE801C|nr:MULTISPECIES: nicotinate-nucleotide--dimethylbenzimidazole phosphoribosyltransferase [unclassified Streptomyces]